MSHAQLQPNQRVEVFKLDTIRLNPDYIPHPETFIKSKLDSLTDRMNQKLHQLKSTDCPPFISQVYGDVRKELYVELETSMKDFSSTKRNEYRHKFYQEIDLKFQEKFQNTLNIRAKYHEFILYKGLALQNTNNEDSESLKDDIGVSVDMLKASIIDLTIDWFVAIDNIVDLLVRCHLYGIKGETIFQDLYSKAHKRWLKTSQMSWTDRIFKGLKTSIDYLKNLVESRGCIEFALYTQDVAATDLFTLVSYLAYGDLIENYLKYLASNEHQGFLVKMKGFMLLLVQSMTNIAQQMYSQLDRCLSASSKKEKEKEELNLYSLLDQIVCLQDNVPFFDEDFIKGNIIKQLIV